MDPRRLLVLLLALAAFAVGCSAGSLDASDGPEARSSAESSGLKPVKIRLPKADRPLHGDRARGSSWRTSGYAPQPVQQPPYTKGLLLDGMLEADVDENGVRLYERDGRRYFHPVGIAQFALAKLDVAVQQNDDAALQSAATNASKLLEIADRHDGGLYFAYPFDFPLGGVKRETIHAPWWSAMGQGQALTLFVRLYELTGKEKWRKAADRTFATLDDRGPRSEPWSVYVDRRGYLWFEEYAGDTKPLLVLNGHMFTIFGLWEYHQLTGSPKAARLFDGGTTLLREYLPLFRVDDDVSYYCLRKPFCQRPLWQNEKYHGIVQEQMRIIADMTDDPWFRREAGRYRQDHPGGN